MKEEESLLLSTSRETQGLSWGSRTDNPLSFRFYSEVAVLQSRALPNKLVVTKFNREMLIRHQIRILDFSCESEDFTSQFQYMIRDRGWKSTLFYMKSCRVALMRQVGGTPLLNEEAIPRLDRNGLPRLIPKKLRDRIIKKDLVAIQEVLTVLRLSYLCDWYPDTPDFSSLDNPTTYDENRGSSKSLLSTSINAMKHLGVQIPIGVLDTHVYHMTTKKGPLGPAQMTSQWELLHPQFAIIRKSQSKLCPSLSAKVWTIEETYEEIGFSKIPNEAPREGGSLRRLSVVKDPEGKQRVIAILDYWSQSVLHGLHSHIIHKLDVWFPGTDVTMDQGSFVSKLPPCTSTFYSFDLSKATDRFPAKFQRDILSHLIGPDKADSWLYLQVGQPFDVGDGNHRSYTVGQPMGAYTSWAVFALCHHLVVRTAGFYAYGNYDFDRYFLLGDDIVIYDPKVAKIYKRQIVDTLGVEISEAKSQISNDSFEFAKRFFVQNCEVSAFPIDQLFRVTNPQTVLAGFLTDVIVRSRGTIILDRVLIRRLVTLFAGDHKSSYSFIKSIWMATYLNLTSRGLALTSVNLNDIPWQGVSISCNSHLSDQQEDVIHWTGVNRVNKLLPILQSQLDSLNKELLSVRSELGYVHHQSFPLLDVLHSSGYKMSIFLDDLRLHNVGRGTKEVITLLLEAEDLINIGHLDFRRKVDRVNLLTHQGCRNLRKYMKYRQKVLDDH